MSIIRHPSFFRRRSAQRGRKQVFRSTGEFEKLLVIAREPAAREIKDTLEKNFFNVHAVSDHDAATREISHEEFEVVIYDTGVSDFSLPSFYSLVEHLRPGLQENFIFLVDAKTAPEIVAFIERVDGMKVWRPLELSELFQMIEIVLGRNALAA